MLFLPKITILHIFDCFGDHIWRNFFFINSSHGTTQTLAQFKVTRFYSCCFACENYRSASRHVGSALYVKPHKTTGDEIFYHNEKFEFVRSSTYGGITDRNIPAVLVVSDLNWQKLKKIFIKQYFITALNYKLRATQRDFSNAILEIRTLPL